VVAVYSILLPIPATHPFDLSTADTALLSLLTTDHVLSRAKSLLLPSALVARSTANHHDSRIVTSSSDCLEGVVKPSTRASLPVCEEPIKATARYEVCWFQLHFTCAVEISKDNMPLEPSETAPSAYINLGHAQILFMMNLMFAYKAEPRPITKACSFQAVKHTCRPTCSRMLISGRSTLLKTFHNS
jgi:hypothetical protein